VNEFWERCILFARYSSCGFLSFCAELTLLYIFYYILLLPYYIAVPAAFLTATTLQYTLCHWWVFKRTKRSVKFEYAYFMLILFSGMLCSLVLVTLFIQVLMVNVLVARIIAGCFTGVWDFYLNARFNFRTHALLRRKHWK